MTNRLELNWKVDGLVDEQRYYCSEAPIDTLTPPIPRAIFTGEIRNYVDYDLIENKSYHIRMSAIKNGVEKFSEELTVSTTNSMIPDLFIGYEGFWFDPSDFSTLFQDIDGTIPVTDVGQSVKKILDKSGNGNHLVGDAKLGLDVDGYHLTFNSTMNKFTTPVFSISNSITTSFKVKTTATSGFVFETSGSSRWVFMSRFDQGYSFGSGGGALAESYTGVGASNSIIKLVSGLGRVSSPYSILRFDGVQVASNPSSQGSAQSGNSSVTIGSRANGTSGFLGKIYKAVFICRLLTNEELISLETELI